MNRCCGKCRTPWDVCGRHNYCACHPRTHTTFADLVRARQGRNHA